jgi:ribosome biogenesis protein Nip4
VYVTRTTDKSFPALATRCQPSASPTLLCAAPPLPLPTAQIWVKPSSEMQYLYGNNVLKSGLARITENTPAYTGVVIYNMADIPLGFGVSAKSTNDCRSLDPSAVVAFHQADCGGWP